MTVRTEFITGTLGLLLCAGGSALVRAAEPSLPVVPVAADEGVARQELEIDPILSEALVLASSTHPTVTAAVVNARAAGVDVKAARWGRFPSVNVQGLLLDQRAGRIQPEVSVELPLWTGGRISAGIHRATAKQRAMQAGYEEAVETISIAVVRSYYDLYRWRGRVTIYADSVDRQKVMVATMERRVAQEVSPQSDLELARMRLLQIQQQLSQAEAQAALVLQQLRELVGDPAYTPDQAVLRPRQWPQFSQDALIEEAKAYDPRLRRLRFEADAIDEEARIYRAGLMPRLSGQYSYNEISGHRVGLVLRAQAEGGLSSLASARASELRGETAQFQAAAAERELRDQIVGDFLDYKSNSERAGIAQAVSASSQRMTESYMRQFTSGRRTWLDVMNAVREATSAQIDALDCEVAALSGMSRLMLRAGRWRLEAKEDQS